MSDRDTDVPRVSVARLALVLLGIVTGVTLVFLAGRMDPIEAFGQEVSPALPLVIVYIAGMLVGRFGAPR
ncbi:hypothetical protein [Demequina pelophila]|uniref:hypothetical protein n=1 Tax=Demequina pelophila TaxID=1638984 RepID=UPI000780F701|nr:hypothetical protein [Demequina pelophila]